MTTNYQRGARAEYRVMGMAWAAGASAVLRTRASKGKADVIVAIGPTVWAVNVKREHWPSPAERAAFHEAWKRTPVIPLLALFRPRHPLAWRVFLRDGRTAELEGNPWG